MMLCFRYGNIDCAGTYFVMLQITTISDKHIGIQMAGLGLANMKVRSDQSFLSNFLIHFLLVLLSGDIGVED